MGIEIKSKKLVDFTEQDCIDLERLKRLLGSTRGQYLISHIGVEISNMVIVATRLTKYEQIVYTSVFYEYLKEAGYRVDNQLYIGSDDISGGEVLPFEYESIEIEKGLFIDTIEAGYLFISSVDDKTKLVMYFQDYGYRDKYAIRVYAARKDRQKASDILKGMEEYGKAHNILKGKKLTPYFNYIPLHDAYTWDSVILPEITKKELRQNIDLLLNSMEIYKKNGMTFKRGLILKGEPGVGKTLVGKILCNISNGATFIWVTPGDLGEAHKVKAICEMARNLAPSVLFLEDVDLYGGPRERENRGILGELMNQLDGLIENEFVVVIATTNRPDELEGALRNRPGRFDRVIDIPKPDDICRLQMLKLYLGKVKLQVEDSNKLFDALVKKTDGFTGAHMKELVNSAVIAAIDGESIGEDGMIILTLEHFTMSLEQVRAKKFNAVGFTPENQSVVNQDELDDLLGD